MKNNLFKFIIPGVLIAAVFVAAAFFIYYLKAEPSTNIPITNYSMKLTSPSFNQNDKIPSTYTCDGRDISPPLHIDGVPAASKSLVLIVDDPDAPVGDWVHWLIWNIKPGTGEIAENSVPDGSVQGTTDFGKPGWGGPCPPSGVHHYQFKLYALDALLNLPASAKKAELEKAMSAHTLDSTMLVGQYQRK